jgi:hypothetical protein
MKCAIALLVLVAALPAAAADEPSAAIPWDAAEQHVGEEAIVEGRVLGVHCSPTSCLLAFEPSFNRFTAVVQARSFDTFPPDDLDHRYGGKVVRVRGRIAKVDGKPEIVVDRPEALELVPDTKRAERNAERALRAQTELIERLGDVLERVEQLTAGLASMQERMDTFLAQLEQREAALAAAQAAAQPPPPAPPSYGDPQPRPAFEALRTVKAGMSRADVERLIGQPLEVESTGTGWTTWYYGYGRSISFDTRGRARSLVGFPPP